MAYQMTWKVYGREGHRQRESFFPSYYLNFSKDGKTRKFRVNNADVTGTHDYSFVTIIRDTKAECLQEFNGQLSDGIFENSNVGKTELVTDVDLETRFEPIECRGHYEPNR